MFITKDIGETEQVALALAAGTLLVTALAAVVFGRIADRAGTKPVLVLGWSLLAVAAFGGLVIQHLPETIVISIGRPTALAALHRRAIVLSGEPASAKARPVLVTA